MVLVRSNDLQICSGVEPVLSGTDWSGINLLLTVSTASNVGMHVRRQVNRDHRFRQFQFEVFDCSIVDVMGVLATSGAKMLVVFS